MQPFQYDLQPQLQEPHTGCNTHIPALLQKTVLSWCFVIECKVSQPPFIQISSLLYCTGSHHPSSRSSFTRAPRFITLYCYVMQRLTPPVIKVKSHSRTTLHYSQFHQVKVIRNSEVLLPNFLWLCKNTRYPALRYEVAITTTANSTAQGGGGSFRNKKPSETIGHCELRGRAKPLMDRKAIYPPTYLPTYLSTYISIYLSI